MTSCSVSQALGLQARPTAPSLFDDGESAQGACILGRLGQLCYLLVSAWGFVFVLNHFKHISAPCMLNLQE